MVKSAVQTDHNEFVRKAEAELTINDPKKTKIVTITILLVYSLTQTSLTLSTKVAYKNEVCQSII